MKPGVSVTRCKINKTLFILIEIFLYNLRPWPGLLVGGGWGGEGYGFGGKWIWGVRGYWFLVERGGGAFDKYPGRVFTAKIMVIFFAKENL